jgi:hypothetical protein
MKKNIYSLFPLAGLLKASNHRYLEFISTLSDPSQGIKKLNTISRTIVCEDRTYKGFNLFDEDDPLFTVIARGEFNITGFRNQSLREFLDKSPAAISRILKRLRIHGLIKRVAHTYKYYLTALGKSVIALGLTLKQLFIIRNLAGLNTMAY